MTERYCVFGNPVAHSKSPRIHTLFARQTGLDIAYDARLAPLDGFAAAVAEFAAAAGKGANVTLPFKEEAFRLCDRRSARAQSAGAVNTLTFDGAGIGGDNTDGAGLVADLMQNLGLPLRGARILLLGAGGAARGVIEPLLDQKPSHLHIANRDASRAAALARAFAAGALSASGLDDLAGSNYDLVINATAAGLSGTAPALPSGLYAPGATAYDMMYGQGLSPFLRGASDDGAARLADGLGMLVEQAAEAFFVWRGVRPETAPVLAALRAA